MIDTSLGPMEEADLYKQEGSLDNENEYTTWVEYYKDGMLVHRSATVNLKQGFIGAAITGNLGGQVFYTYLHCRPDGTPFYVGKGSGKRSHWFYQRTKHHNHIIAKYGIENIGVFVFPCESEEQAFVDEQHQIAQLRREGAKLCNLTDGGEGKSGFIPSQETRQKMSIASKKLVKSPEFISHQKHIKGVRYGTDESYKRMGVTKSKPVHCVELNTMFESVSEAAEFTGVSISGVSCVCLNKRNSAYGLHFHFI